MKSLLVLLGRTRWAGFVLLMCNTSFAQYSIDWITVHGGEGTTSSGVYEISGTIGQPDAGSVIAGEFVIGGGYWSDLDAAPEPGAPGLSIEGLSPGSADNLSFVLAPKTGEPFPIQTFGWGADGLRASFSAIGNRVYTMQRSQDFLSWTDLVSQATVGDGAIWLSDTNPPAGRAFYRIFSHRERSRQQASNIRAL